LPIRFRGGLPLEVQLAEDVVLLKALFEYQLAMAVYEGTAAGGVKWWFHKRYEPQGVLSLASRVRQVQTSAAAPTPSSM
jgi:hypothetical protein